MLELLKTISGLILLLIPFLLIFGFKNRRQGFLYILTAVITFHISVALLTQFFHIFLYPVIFGLNLLVAGGVLFIVFRRRDKFSFKNCINLKKNWLIIAAFLIIFLNLYSIHYNYSGYLTDSKGTHKVESADYPYPYYSDEWVGVSYINYAINKNCLPIKNPLIDGWAHEESSNVFVVFFSLLAELFLLINIPALTGYNVLTIFLGLLLCFLIYLLLRKNKIQKLPAIIATLSLPYIVNGANLPGLWYLIPYSGGMIIFLLTLIALSGGQIKKALIDATLTLLIYPPFIVLIAPAFLAWLIFDKKLNTPKKIKITLIGLVAFSIAALITILLQDDVKSFWTLIVSYLWRISQNFGIVSLPIWRIIPFWILPFSLIGLIPIIKKKIYTLLFPILISLCFWLFYSQSIYFFIIDYTRIAMIASWLMVISAGFGLNYSFEILKKEFPSFSNKDSRLIITFLILSLFFIAAFFYTNRDSWLRLTLTIKNPQGTLTFKPNAPAGSYLTDDDLKLFKMIPENQRFLAPSWKGLVIGVATNNYPLDSKDSIISNKFINYNDFISEDCAKKSASAEKNDIRYLYSAPFNCPNFKLIGSSSEGLFLYSFK